MRSKKAISEFNKIRKIILKRDNYFCKFGRYCKKPIRLAIHHIDCNPENNIPENLITLCKHCHEFFHTCIDDTYFLNIQQDLEKALKYLKICKTKNITLSSFSKKNKIDKRYLSKAIMMCEKYFYDEI